MGNVIRTAVLEENEEIPLGAAEAFGQENESTVDMMGCLRSYIFDTVAHPTFSAAKSTVLGPEKWASVAAD
ncbi:hypothetical protein FDECE_18217 [Fusarium decemcellulare]|nr:hypothetical protein FDECE_18217 [Fusarium decemcellulare]